MIKTKTSFVIFLNYLIIVLNSLEIENVSTKNCPRINNAIQLDIYGASPVRDPIWDTIVGSCWNNST